MILVCQPPIARGPNKGLTATGTQAGYQRHRKLGEPPCSACVKGHSKTTGAWRKANPDRARASGRKGNARYYEANREQLRKKTRRWYEANRERALERNQAWRSANRERVKEYSREWLAANPEKAREQTRLRRARKARASALRFTQDQLDARMAFWGNRCWMCGGPFEHVDHVKPLSRGGAHILANLRPACASCNLSKRDTWNGVSALPPVIDLGLLKESV